jgi:hypothetical protein
MKLLTLLSIIIIVIFISCQKEIDWGLGGGNNASQLLVRIKSQTGTDTSQLDYYYDAAKRLIREKTTGNTAGTSLDNELIINRNTTGTITTTIQKAAALVAVGIDSVVTTFYYNTGTSKYTASVFVLPVPGFTVKDSAVYTYDAANRIISDAHYLQVTGLPLPLPPILSLKNNYTYSSTGNNLLNIQQEAASTPGGPLSPVASQTYLYDSKVNPLNILNEAILIARPGLFSANNPAKQTVANTISPANDFTMDYTYVYNNANVPDSSFATRTPGGTVTVSKYFYR